MTMCIFSKRRVLLSCLVAVRIFKAIIEGFHFAVIKACDELEFALKGKESTAFIRAVEYSINYRDLSLKPLCASEFGNPNHNPAALDFQMSDLPRDGSVSVQPLSRNLITANVLDASHISANDIGEKLTSVEEKSANKADCSDPFQVQFNSTLNQISSGDSVPIQVDTSLDRTLLTPQCKTVRFETIPKSARSIQDVTQSASDEIANISAAPTVYKLNSSDQGSALNMNEEDNTQNDLSGSHLSNVAKPILTQIKTKQSLPSATPHQRNLNSKEHDAIQSSTNQADIGTQEHTIGRNIWSSNPSVAASFKDDIQCPKRSGQHKGDLSIKNGNTEQAKITNSPHRVKTKFSCLNSGDDGTNPAASSDSEQIVLTNYAEALSYPEYLEKSIPLICRIEAKVISLCYKNYQKLSLSEMDWSSVDPELTELFQMCDNVRELPSELIVLQYGFEIKAILEYLQNEIELSLMLKNRAKISLCVKKLAVKLERARKLLFDVDEECVKLRMQVENVRTHL